MFPDKDQKNVLDCRTQTNTWITINLGHNLWVSYDHYIFNTPELRTWRSLLDDQGKVYVEIYYRNIWLEIMWLWLAYHYVFILSMMIHTI